MRIPLLIEQIYLASVGMLLLAHVSYCQTPVEAMNKIKSALAARDTSPATLDGVARIANDILHTPKPASISDRQWTALEATAHKGLGWVNMLRNQAALAEAHLSASLSACAEDGEVPFWLASVIKIQKAEKWQTRALFYLARAGVYTGPGALSRPQRLNVLEFTKASFTRYHGDDNDGFDSLLKLASDHPSPPADFYIPSLRERP